MDLQAISWKTPLHSAAEMGHAAVTGQLIAAPCNMDLQDKNEHDSVMKHLLAACCNVDLQTKRGFTSLQLAQRAGAQAQL